MEVEPVDGGGDGGEVPLNDVLQVTKAAMNNAVCVINNLRREKEDILELYQTALAELREHYASRSGVLDFSGISTGATASTPSITAGGGAVAGASASNGASVQELLAKDSQIGTLRRDLERALQRATKAENEGALVKRKSAEDGETISRLQAEVTSLLELRIRNQSALSARSDTAHRLAREAEARTAASQAVSKRSEFLERERARLAAEAAELRSKLNVLTAEGAAASNAHNDTMVALRRAVADEKRRGDAVNTAVAALQDEVAALQKARDKDRMDAAAESKHLSDIVAMHKEEAKDMEAELARYKALLNTVTGDKLDAGFGRGAATKALDAHAEALLKELQATLDAKLAQLERQRTVVDEARDNERRASIAYENAAREADQERRRAREKEAENEVLNKENSELRRKCAKLQDDVIIAGGYTRRDGNGEQVIGLSPFATAASDR